MLAVLVGVSFWTGTTAMAAPFSATCVLLALFPQSPFSSARTVLLSHLLCLGAGMLALLLPLPLPLQLLSAVWLALMLMAWQGAVHAPAAAHAAIVALGAQQLPAYPASVVAVAGGFALMAQLNARRHA